MNCIVVKIGGRLAAEAGLVRGLAEELKALGQALRPVLVHGGGAEVTELSRTLGAEPVFREGIRITSPREMDIVEMVLSGKTNKRLVRLLQSAGLDAVGLSGADGGLMRGESLGEVDGTPTRTGEIRLVCPDLVELLLEQGYLPVISPVSMDSAGGALNVNADTAALEVACALKSGTLLFLSDIPGIRMGDRVADCLTETESLQAVLDGQITGGMIPKVRSSLAALRRGVGQIIIGEHAGRGSLRELLEGRRGTRLVLDRKEKSS